MTKLEFIHIFRKMRKKYDFEFVDGCWEWQGSRDSAGYGRVKVESQHYTVAHRVVYEKFRRSIPEGYVIHHQCNNKRCVNPLHLEATTPEQNTRYAHEDGLCSTDSPTRREALEIRRRYRELESVLDIVESTDWGVGVIRKVLRGEHSVVSDLDPALPNKTPVQFPD